VRNSVLAIIFIRAHAHTYTRVPQDVCKISWWYYMRHFELKKPHQHMPKYQLLGHYKHLPVSRYCIVGISSYKSPSCLLSPLANTTHSFFVLILDHGLGLQGHQILHPSTSCGPHKRHFLSVQKHSQGKNSCSESQRLLTT
jgi:hypothetical protein